MARAHDWDGMEKEAVQLKRMVKTVKSLGDYLSDMPKPGYFRDNISKQVIVLSDCEAPRLRRYIRLLNNFLFVVTGTADREKIIAKKKEVEDELSKKEDPNDIK